MKNEAPAGFRGHDRTLAIVDEVRFPELPEQVSGANQDTSGDDDGTHTDILLRTFVRRE